ncbi:MAG: DUF5320 domain-containing protein [Anaerolineales bacterium]|nr:DUF5320 domain-containing protein [Anaerolineales bacterium]
MPGRDRTGSLGAGPSSGRGMGYCCSYDWREYVRPAVGMRSGFAFRRAGIGRGWRHRWHSLDTPELAPLTPEQESAVLKAQAERLKSELDAIQKRIEALETK